jgi:hypothetical protein
MEPEDSLPCSQSPPLDPFLSQVNLVHTSRSIPLKSILILSFHLLLDLRSGLFPSGFLTKMLYTFSSFLCVLNAPYPILLDWSPEYVLKSTHYEVSHCAVISSGLNDRGSRVRFPAGTGHFSLLHLVQTGSGAHPASYQTEPGSSFPVGKAAGTWSWLLTSI